MEEFVHYTHTGDPVDVTFGVKELKVLHPKPEMWSFKFLLHYCEWITSKNIILTDKNFWSQILLSLINSLLMSIINFYSW